MICVMSRCAVSVRAGATYSLKPPSCAQHHQRGYTHWVYRLNRVTMPATDPRIDRLPFSYPVAIDVVAYRVDDTEKFMAYDTGIFYPGLSPDKYDCRNRRYPRQFHFNANFTRRAAEARARFDEIQCIRFSITMLLFCSLPVPRW